MHQPWIPGSQVTYGPMWGQRHPTAGWLCCQEFCPLVGDTTCSQIRGDKMRLGKDLQKMEMENNKSEIRILKTKS